MTTCKAKKTNGENCQAKPKAGESYCFMHNPNQARKQALARRKGGSTHKTSHGGTTSSIPNEILTLQDARCILLYALQEVLPMDNSIPRARVLIALAEAFVRSIEIGEIENRLAALEAKQ